MRFALLVFALGPVSCVAPPRADVEPVTRPNILLLVSEDNGPELGCYGDPFARTPRIDRLAAEGVLFQRAFVPYSVCSPSRACFLTGLHPQQNGQIGLATHKFAMTREWPNLASLLKEAGYRTGRIGKLHVNPEPAFPFDFVRFPGSNFNERRVVGFADAAAEFLAAGDDPFFLSVNFPDAHFPLIAQQDGLPAVPHRADEVSPLPWVGADSPRLRKATADYYSCMARLDAAVGLVLDALEASGLAEDTLVIYIGDHGAQFSRGKTSCYDAGLRVPFIVRWPGHAEPGERTARLVSTLDIVPTVCGAVGIDLPEALTGRLLQPLLRSEDVPWRTHVFAMGTGSAPVLNWVQFAVRGERYKLIVNPQAGAENRCARAYLEQHNAHFIAGTNAGEIARASSAVQAAYTTYLHPPAVELYDLDEDPTELVNRAADPELAAVRHELEAELARFRQRIGDPFLDTDVLARFLAEQEAGLTRNYRREKDFRWGYLDEFDPR